MEHVVPRHSWVLGLALLAVAHGRADSIVLHNGQAAQTTVVDTVGCNVTILRSGAQVPIEKKLIRFVVVGSDTLRYEGFVCRDTVRRAVKFRETPEFKLWQRIGQCQPNKAVMADSVPVGLLLSPLYGSTDKEYTELLRDNLNAVLQKQGHSVAEVDVAWVSRHLGDAQCTPRYVGLTRELVDVAERYGSKGVVNVGVMRMWTDVERAKTQVRAHFMVVDLHRSTFAYDTVVVIRGRARSPGVVTIVPNRIDTVDVRGEVESCFRWAARDVAWGVKQYLRWADLQRHRARKRAAREARRGIATAEKQ